MISEHAMLVLMLLLAVAVVLLAVTLTIYSLKAECSDAGKVGPWS